MVRKLIWVLLVAALCVYGTGCDKIGKLGVTGGISGKVMNPDGSPHGLVALVLVDRKTGAETQQQTAEDTGNFFFQKVPAGTYFIKVEGLTGHEIPSDQTDVKLAMGRTVEHDVHLNPPSDAPPPASNP